MKEYILPIGILFILIGFALIIIGSFLSAPKETKTGVAVGGFFGPIPFGFATDKKLLYVLIGFMAFLFAVWLALRFFRI